jgi:ubiquinone/menaquinone biosynthesis C-methylase UbiE
VRRPSQPPSQATPSQPLPQPAASEPPTHLARLARFYEDAYTHEPADADRYARWRALGAVAKADHVTALCARAGIQPANTLEVGCGDGALLCELHRRGFGGRLSGVEISRAAVSIAADRPQIDSVALYDGLHLPARDREYALGIVCHVLEHEPDPVGVLAEVARTCQAAVVEVPLEANFSARRRSRRQQATEIGHLQRLDRAAARRIVTGAGLVIAGELEDALPLEAHRFLARTRRSRAAAVAKWALRTALHRAMPGLARRLFTVHYACLCLPAS